MNTFKGFENILYRPNGETFSDIALSLFRFQAANNTLYNQYLKNLSVVPDEVRSVEQIPYLPIAFFKHAMVQTGNWKPELTFSSSGTTGSQVSRHAIYSAQKYFANAKRCFEFFFGDVSSYYFLALLPSYLERRDSSLVAMINYFIQSSNSAYGGFYLYETDKLLRDIDALRAKGDRKIMLWGVSFALLDLAEKYKPDLGDCVVIETGGMKGKRRELTRQELHSALSEGFSVEKIYSEYGMSELLSQAYTRGNDRFYCGDTMKIIAREVTDPMNKGIIAETGGLNVIDLANIYSVAFIETEDIGKVYSDGSFEVLGRLDNSDVRGCNLLV